LKAFCVENNERYLIEEVSLIVYHTDYMLFTSYRMRV
jgi:hypothetical protein